MNNQSIELAIKNIQKHGDTDIFPFPIENRIICDKKSDIIELIQRMDGDFTNRIDTDAPENITVCSPCGYTGFRWATLVDPIWNAYYLSLIIDLASKLEISRVTPEYVFSYRYSPDLATGDLFDRGHNWKKYIEKSIEISGSYKYVVTCDIADYYTRIYHHRVENELDRACHDDASVGKCIKLLTRFSNLTSYGLPIGGPASRILAEVALNSMDKILQYEYKFTRFVDEYTVFCESYEEAHKCLSTINNKLMKNEGLSLQKYKTNIYKKEEFANVSASKISTDSENENKRSFMALSLSFDPYSPNSVEEYTELKTRVRALNVVGLLTEELKKSRIDQPFGRHLMRAVEVMDDRDVNDAVDIMSNDYEKLYPIFGGFAAIVSRNWERLTDSTKNKIRIENKKCILGKSWVIQNEINMAFLLRMMSVDRTTDNEVFTVSLYRENPESILSKMMAIRNMVKWNVEHFIMDKKSNFTSMNSWERRQMIIGSCILGDEGDHWRKKVKRGFSDFEKIVASWAELKAIDGTLNGAL
jgi:hypothetical protein